MKYLCHAVLHRGIVYYNTIINVNQNSVSLLAYQGEEEATAFVNGIIAIVDYRSLSEKCINDLCDIVDECDDIEEMIDAVNPYMTSKDMFVIDNSSFGLLSISPEIKILYSCHS